MRPIFAVVLIFGLLTAGNLLTGCAPEDSQTSISEPAPETSDKPPYQVSSIDYTPECPFGSCIVTATGKIKFNRNFDYFELNFKCESEDGTVFVHMLDNFTLVDEGETHKIEAVGFGGDRDDIKGAECWLDSWKGY